MKKIFFILLILLLVIAVPHLAYTQLVNEKYSKKNDSQNNLQKLYDDYINQGLSCLEQNQLNNAKYSFFKARELVPDKSEAYIDLAVVSIKRGNYRSAIITLKKAESLQDNTKKDIVFYNLGLCLQKNSEYQEAVKYYDKATNINPLLKEALFNRGMLYLKNGQPDMALIDLVKAGTLFKSRGQKTIVDKCEENISYLIEKNQQNKEVAKKLLEEGSKSFENGRQEEGVVLLNVSALCDTTNKETYYRLGVMHVRMENLKQAIECFKKTVELDPKDINAYINLGGAYGRLKEYKEALDALHKALDLEKRNPKIYYNIAMVYLNIGKNNGAISYLKKAKALATDKEDKQLLEKIDEAGRLLKI